MQRLVPLKEKEGGNLRHTDTNTQRKGGHKKIEAEISNCKTTLVAEGSHQMFKEGHGMDSSSDLPEGINPVYTLILEFLFVEQQKNTFLLFEATNFAVTFYSSPGTL